MSVLRLKKTLFSLKQAPGEWNNRIGKYFLKIYFVRVTYEHAHYLKTYNNGNMLLVCLYVDDMIFTKNNTKLFKVFKMAMVKEFEMKNGGLMPYFLGIKVKQMKD